MKLRATLTTPAIVTAIAGVVTLIAILPAAAQTTPTATRSFEPASVDPRRQVTVTIQASGYGAAGGITETLPAGFSYVRSSLDDFAVTELDNNRVRFTIQGVTSFTYTVRASRTPGSYTFSGTLRDANRNDHLVGGDDRVTVTGPTPVGTPTATATPTPTEPPTTPYAARSFDSTLVDPAWRLTVTITAANYGLVGEITETLPPGFSYVSTNDLDASRVIISGQNVRFTLQGHTSFRYTVIASGTPGVHAFSGTLRDSNNNDHTVGGDTSVTVRYLSERTPTATRSFSSTTPTPGANMTVTIAVENYGALGAVFETIPTGFRYVSSNIPPARVSQSGQVVTFRLQDETAVTYVVTASTAERGYGFSGRLLDSTNRGYDIGGADRLTVTSTGNGDGSPQTTPTGQPTQSANLPPTFAEGSSTSRSIDEGLSPGTNVGDPLTAIDPNDDILEYRLSGTDHAAFEIDASTGQITVAEGTNLDHETKNSYSVAVEVTDQSNATDDIAVTIFVNNIDEPGTITLSSESPQVGTTVTATLLDPDGPASDVIWTWATTSDENQAFWNPISGATTPSYALTSADAGKHLRVLAHYSDEHGSGKTAQAVAAVPTTSNTPVPTDTPTPLPTATHTPMPTDTPTPLPTPTNTPVPTDTPTPEPTATHTPVPADTPTPTNTPIPTDTPTPAPSPTHTPVPTDTPTPLPTPTNTPVPTDTPIPPPTPTNTPKPTDTPEPTRTPKPQPTHTPIPTDTPTPTNTPVLSYLPTREPTTTPLTPEEAGRGIPPWAIPLAIIVALALLAAATIILARRRP